MSKASDAARSPTRRETPSGHAASTRSRRSPPTSAVGSVSRRPPPTSAVGRVSCVSAPYRRRPFVAPRGSSRPRRRACPPCGTPLCVLPTSAAVRRAAPLEPSAAGRLSAVCHAHPLRVRPTSAAVRRAAPPEPLAAPRAAHCRCRQCSAHCCCLPRVEVCRASRSAVRRGLPCVAPRRSGCPRRLACRSLLALPLRPCVAHSVHDRRRGAGRA
jgi:hypothetical protein